MPDPHLQTALVSSRICHDLVSPMSSVASAIEILDDQSSDEAMRTLAEDLLRQGAQKLKASLMFQRYAFGSMSLSDRVADIHTVKDILDNYAALYAPSLEWHLEKTDLTYFQTRLLLHMAYIGLHSLPRGGVVKIEIKASGPACTSLILTSEGPRAILRPDIQAAILQTAPEDGWSARNIHMQICTDIARQLGGRLEAERQTAERVIYKAEDLKNEARQDYSNLVDA